MRNQQLRYSQLKAVSGQVWPKLLIVAHRLVKACSLVEERCVARQCLPAGVVGKLVRVKENVEVDPFCSLVEATQIKNVASQHHGSHHPVELVELPAIVHGQLKPKRSFLIPLKPHFHLADVHTQHVAAAVGKPNLVQLQLRAVLERSLQDIFDEAVLYGFPRELHLLYVVHWVIQSSTLRLVKGLLQKA